MHSGNLERWMDFPINHSHETYMRRALELARNGAGHVSPNPLVGCVIVHEGRIIGEGWHKKYGQAHAEVSAIASVVDKQLLSESTLYVNLEPCSHKGKTPPCADLLIAHNVKKVVIANRDSNPLVAGKGILKLKEAGIAVIADILSGEGYQLNNRFFTYMEKRRPRLILKWAETSDGFIARKNKDSKWISDDYSRQLVHKWRSEEDAVMVASATAWHDNPMLNVREWTGRNPLRIVVDRFLKLGPNLHLFNRKQKTICYNVVKEDSSDGLDFVKLHEQNFLDAMIDDLYRRNIQSVIVEGGGQLLKSFIEAKLWDEARIFTSPQRFGNGVPAPRITGVLVEQMKLNKDWLRILTPVN